MKTGLIYRFKNVGISIHIYLVLHIRIYLKALRYTVSCRPSCLDQQYKKRRELQCQFSEKNDGEFNVDSFILKKEAEKHGKYMPTTRTDVRNCKKHE